MSAHRSCNPSFGSVQATLNEKNSPEVLEFKEDLVTRLQDSLKKQASPLGLSTGPTAHVHMQAFITHNHGHLCPPLPNIHSHTRECVSANAHSVPRRYL